MEQSSEDSSFFICDDDIAISNCKTLVVPLLSIGNVPQLALDLLICSLDLKRCGFINDSSIIAMASTNVYSNNDEISFACEVFCSKEVAFLQIRSKIEQNMIGKFCKRLGAWIEKTGFQEVLIVGSSDSAWLMRPDEDVKLMYLCENEERRAKLSAMGLMPMEWNKEMVEKNEQSLGQSESMADTVLGTRTFAALLRDNVDKQKSVGVFLFCAEGENMREAQILLSVMIKYLDIKIEELKFPVSWKYMVTEEEQQKLRMMFQ